MRKKFLKALICITAVLVIIRLTMIGTAHSESSNIIDEVVSETTVITIAKTTMVATTEPKTETTTDVVTEKVVEPQKPTELKEIHTTEPKSEQENNNALCSASQFARMGVIRWNGWRWTWYSEKVLPGGGLDIPGRHRDIDGYVCDENDYICLSSSSLKRGAVIDTPFGKQGKVYDTGCASDVVDVYVSW